MNFLHLLSVLAKVWVLSSAFEKIYCLSLGISCHKYFDLSKSTWGEKYYSPTLFFSRAKFYSQLHHRIIRIVYLAYFLANDCFFYSPSISWTPTVCMFYFPYYWYKYWVNPILSLVYFLFVQYCLNIIVYALWSCYLET
jgi:hypothetical protein